MQKIIIISSFLLLQLALLQTVNCIPTAKDVPEIADKTADKFDVVANTILTEAPPLVVSVSEAAYPEGKASCKAVGVSCTRPEECCTQRCLTYAGKCVT